MSIETTLTRPPRPKTRCSAGGLRRRFRGEIVEPGDPGYDEARSVWNGMIDRRPALVARCADEADVAAAVTFAREARLLVAVRGGGHNVAGTGTCDGGIVIDLSPMRRVEVDPGSRTVRAQAGCTWADVDGATQAHGLAVPGGVVSETGIAGLTLSGGYSHHRRAHGMTIDNLLAAEVVTADGERIRASESENPELFWALRGGGGNFGVVTTFEYRAHRLGPDVYRAEVMYPVEDAPRVLRAWREAIQDAPDEVTSDAAFWAFPAIPEIPEELHNVPFIYTGGVYAGPAEEGERALRPLRELGVPIVDQSGVTPYLSVQTAFDAFLPAGRRYYWKSLYLERLSDEVIDFVVKRAGTTPSPQTLMILRQLGGAMARVPEQATAFGDRTAPFNLSIDSGWEDPADDGRNVDWTRAFWTEAQRFSNGRTYFNFAGLLEEGEALVETSYGANYERLVAVKTAYDPANLFRLNQNITPRA